VTEGNDKNKKRRRTWWIIFAVVIVVGAVIGWRIWRNQQNNSQVLANLETEPFQRMSLDANIFGTGTVQPSQIAVLTWSTNGVVGEVNISLGQTVEKDMLLMSLDSDSLPVDVLQAQIDVITAQNNLDALYDTLESDLAQAKLDLINAEEDLEDLENEREIMNYQRCTDDRIEELEDDLEFAEDIYGIRQTPENLRAVNTAQANLDFCRADFTEREVAEAELKVALAEEKVADFQEQVDLLEDGPDPDQVKIYETQLTIAQSRLDSPLIEAPFDGVATVLYAQEGDIVQAGQQALQIDDLSQLYLDVQISEIDIPNVAVGQLAELVFDAYFESTFNGEVVEIAPIGENVQGVVEYNVRINMQNTNGRIKPGMTASVNIVVDEKEDVFVVPNDAIVSIDGEEYVYVRRNGAFEAVAVTLGSYSEFYSEVVEADLEEGEMIIRNPPEEITGEMPFGGPPSGGFGPFGN